MTGELLNVNLANWTFDFWTLDSWTLDFWNLKTFEPWISKPWRFEPWTFEPWIFEPWTFEPWISKPWTFEPSTLKNQTFDFDFFLDIWKIDIWIFELWTIEPWWFENRTEIFLYLTVILINVRLYQTLHFLRLKIYFYLCMCFLGLEYLINHGIPLNYTCHDLSWLTHRFTSTPTLNVFWVYSLQNSAQNYSDTLELTSIFHVLTWRTKNVKIQVKLETLLR